MAEQFASLLRKPGQGVNFECNTFPVFSVNRCCRCLIFLKYMRVHEQNDYLNLIMSDPSSSSQLVVFFLLLILMRPLSVTSIDTSTFNLKPQISVTGTWKMSNCNLWLHGCS